MGLRIKQLPLILPIVMSTLILDACGSRFWTQRRANPVIEDYVGGGLDPSDALVGSLSTLASHRTIFVRVNVPKGGVGQVGQFCAEPSPGTGEYR